MVKTDGVATKKFVGDVVNKSAKRTEEKLIGVIRSVKDGLYIELHGEIQDLGKELHAEMEKNQEEIMEKFDSFAGMVKKFDEERVVLSYRVSGHSDQFEDYDKRLRELEKISLQ